MSHHIHVILIILIFLIILIILIIITIITIKFNLTTMIKLKLSQTSDFTSRCFQLLIKIQVCFHMPPVRGD
jgi:hypothetical protein